MRAGEHLELLVERIRRLAAIGAAAFLLVAIGYWFVQIVQGAQYRQQAENNRLRQDAILAPRGLIVDRHGHRLVENMASYNLRLDRSASDDVAGSLRFAARVLGRDRDALAEVLQRYGAVPSFVPVLLAEDLTLNEVARFEVAGLEHPEFEVEVLHRRLYRHGSQTAHLLGYLGEVEEGQLGAGNEELEAGDLVGKRGIEETYDSVLRGHDGEQVFVVDSRGKFVEQLRVDTARPGEEITLSLDLELQQEAVHLLGDQVGAVVALDPWSGEVRAMVSSPSYDPNRFSRRLDREEWYEILETPHQALQNRAIQNTYPPGSVFKVVMAFAALEEGVVSPEDTFFCGGQVRLHNRSWRCWNRAGHGRVNLHEALRGSCDIYFYQVGQLLGVDAIAKWARAFGLGRLTGIDLGGERHGLVPDSAWSMRVRGSPWYLGETISVAIGQGPLLVTPLQVAVVMAAVANGGTLVSPHLVPSQKGREGEHITLAPEDLEAVRQALWSVVNEGGTGVRARVAGADIVGKTGTAQVVQQKTWTESAELPFQYRDHAWFASYAPLDHPELVMVVFVEHGGQGSRAAAPIARAMYEKYFDSKRRPAGST